MKNKKKRSFIGTITAIIIIVLIITPLIILLSLGGFFNTNPKVEVKPNNCYNGTIFVISDEDYSPYSYYDEQHNITGHDVELITLIANKLEMNLSLSLRSWNDGINAAVSGQTDILMTCDYSDSFDGVDKLLKTQPTSNDDYIVFSKVRINSVEELFYKKCGIMKNGNVSTALTELQLGGNCVEFANNREAMKALENGSVDCAIMRKAVGESLLAELDYKDINSTISIGQSYMCFGVSKNNQKLADQINEAIDTLRADGVITDLHNKWLTSFFHNQTFGETASEYAWILVIFAAAIIIVILVYYSYKRRQHKSEIERHRYIEIIDNLANDYECVHYVELQENKADDEAQLLRINDTIVRNIPEWSVESNYQKLIRIFVEKTVYPTDRQTFIEKTRRETVLENLKTNKNYFVNFRVVFDDTPQFYQLKYTSVHNDGDKPTALVIGLHNIDTETKKEIEKNQLLQTALENADVANKSKTSFLFSMSHDIRTPMNVIIGFTNLAKKNINNKEKVLDCLDKTQQASNMLLTLINSILDMSRIESGKVMLQEMAGDITYSFFNIENTMQELASAKNIALSFEVSDIKNKYVYADINRCLRVFTNIISNAIKYTPEGGQIKVKCVQISDVEDGCARYRYTFEDNGMGMSEEFQKHVFEEFAREENSTISGIQGTGLGLALCKSLVTVMNGTITFESHQGKGTTFTVELPFKVQDENEPFKYIDPITGSLIDANTEVPQQKHQSLYGKRVLLVEDNELNCEITADILEDAGLVVDTAVNGKEAVDAIKQKGVDYYSFILMDIQMPIMNGYEATEEIRKMVNGDKIPIIALSANAFIEDAKKSIDSGMDGHIAKPINVNVLLDSLRNSIR